MLLINGYTNKLTQRLGIAPPEGRLYWSNGLYLPMKVLKDWNLCFIHPASGSLSTAKERFHCGYDFAHKHERKLRDHTLISGNMLQMVAHSQGVAFAEGIAAYLYEEKSIQTDLLVALQGEQMVTTPQCRNAVDTRIVLRTRGDIITNKYNENLRLYDISIVEESLRSGYIKYDFFYSDEEKAVSTLYFKGSFGWRKAHVPHRHRPQYLWDAVKHAVQLNDASRADNVYTHRSSRLSQLIRQTNNQN